MESESNDLWWDYWWGKVQEAEDFLHSINEELASNNRAPITARPGYIETCPWTIMYGSVQQAMSVIALNSVTERIKKDLEVSKVTDRLDKLYRMVSDLGVDSPSRNLVWKLREKYQKVMDKNS
ncbi:hypothetical protein H6770_03350 [Candidatus Peribacteria bacterium]|nr:hypothetical protein [Candidatus Peribacteria bacterium]